MADRILIKDLALRTIIGINDAERRARQDVLINITLHAETSAAGASDAIEDAVNYRTITKRVIRLVGGSQFFLVERMAARIAATCLEDERVAAVDVRVEKPGALRFARSVGVEIHRSRADGQRKRNQAFVSLGSNLDPETNLPEAVRLLAARSCLVATSHVYQTIPVGSTGQPDFLNAVALIETDLSAARLKSEVLEGIEQELGRVRTADKYAARTIDLDILLYNDEVFDLGGRRIPDPDIPRLAYLAVPLSDIAVGRRHPETGQTLSEIVRRLPQRQITRRLDVRLQPDPVHEGG